MNVAKVGCADVLAFRTFLKRQKFSGRTLYNHFLNIAFFVWAKGEEDTLGLNDNDWPEKPERDREAYTEEEIKKTMGDRGRDVSGIGAQGRREERWSITATMGA